jgi:hypothetical protein
MDHVSHTIYQTTDGSAEWKGRYALRSPKANIQGSKTEGIAHEKGGIRVLSKHEFILRGTSSFKLYANTLDSKVKVKYSIIDQDKLVVTSGETYETTLIEWGTLEPSFKGSKAYENAFTLILYYQPEKGKKNSKEVETFDCPKMEIQFVV